jgi:membrane-associated phospholipid phosphatase
VDRRRLTDGVIAFYLQTTAALAIAFREALPDWKLVAGAHLAARFAGALAAIPAPAAAGRGALPPGLVSRHERRFLFWLLPLCAGVALATVYGRFHYAVDVLAGWILALGVVLGYRVLGSPWVSSRSR